MINGGGGYLRLTPSVPLLVLLVPVSTGGGYQLVPGGGGVPVFSRDGIRNVPTSVPCERHARTDTESANGSLSS